MNFSLLHLKLTLTYYSGLSISVWQLLPNLSSLVSWLPSLHCCRDGIPQFHYKKDIIVKLLSTIFSAGISPSPVILWTIMKPNVSICNISLCLEMTIVIIILLTKPLRDLGKIILLTIFPFSSELQFSSKLPCIRSFFSATEQLEQYLLNKSQNDWL